VKRGTTALVQLAAEGGDGRIAAGRLQEAVELGRNLLQQAGSDPALRVTRDELSVVEAEVEWVRGRLHAVGKSTARHQIEKTLKEV
jgi:hypothetical protein